MMHRLSLNPDESMKWIYDQAHPNYYSDEAKHLREARAAAIRSAPRWMVEEAMMNDQLFPPNKPTP